MLRLRQGLDTRNEGQTLGSVRAAGLGLERGQGRFAFPGQEENGGEMLLEQRPAMRPSWDRLSGKKEDLGQGQGGGEVPWSLARCRSGAQTLPTGMPCLSRSPTG